MDDLSQLQAPPKAVRRENTYIMTPAGYGDVRARQGCCALCKRQLTLRSRVSAYLKHTHTSKPSPLPPKETAAT